MSHEAIVTTRYKDSVGVWTIGVGVTDAAGASIKPSTFKGQITVQEAVDMFERVLRTYEAAVNRAINVPLEQHQFDALVSFHYNTGGIAKSNTRRLINAGDVIGGGKAMMGWTRPPEIAARRAKEVDLFVTGKYGNGVVSVYPASTKGNVLWSKGKRVNLRGMLSGPDNVPAPKPRPKMDAIVRDAAATDRISTTNIASGVAGVGGAIATGNQIADAAAQASSGIDTLMSVGPWVLLLIVVVGAAWYIWRERKRKQKQAQEALL